MWDKILTLAFMGSFLSAAVRMAIPLAYAALGEMISQKSGTINIGLEANMLGGAFLGFAVTYWTGSLPLGFWLEWLQAHVSACCTPSFRFTCGRTRT